MFSSHPGFTFKPAARHNCRRSPTELQSSLPWDVERSWTFLSSSLKKKCWCYSSCVEFPHFPALFQGRPEPGPRSHYGWSSRINVYHCSQLSLVIEHATLSAIPNPQNVSQEHVNRKSQNLKLSFATTTSSTYHHQLQAPCKQMPCVYLLAVLSMTSLKKTTSTWGNRSIFKIAFNQTHKLPASRKHFPISKVDDQSAKVRCIVKSATVAFTHKPRGVIFPKHLGLTIRIIVAVTWEVHQTPWKTAGLRNSRETTYLKLKLAKQNQATFVLKACYTVPLPQTIALHIQLMQSSWEVLVELLGLPVTIR